MSKKRLFAEIAKTEKQADGTLIVEGFASSGAVDSDGETITPDAMKNAIPDYMKFGAVREMHDATKAAGTALEAEVMEDGRTRFVAHVVDPVAVLKVESGVYKGFSIGAGIPKGGRDAANKLRINVIKLREVSLVDRPANPDAVIECYKADGSNDPEDEDTDGEGDDPDLKKGMWTVSRLTDAISTLKCAVMDTEFEVKLGDHTQKTLDAMKDCLKSLAPVVQKYLAEELALATKADTDAAAEALTKAQGATTAVQHELDALKKANAQRDEDEAAEQAQVIEIAKAIKLDVGEGAGVRELLKASVVELNSTRLKMEELLKRAAPPKGYRHQVQVLSKAQDSGGVDDTVKPIAKSDGSVDDVATLVKAAQQNPFPVTLQS